MKRFILISLCLLFGSAVGLFAQELSKDDFIASSSSGSSVAMKIGIGAGVNVAGLSSSNSEFPGTGIRPGFNGGVMFNLRFHPRDEMSTAEQGLFAIQPEIRYSTMGGNSNDFKLGLSYLTVPIMFQVYPTANFFIEAGPVMAINTSHTPNTTVINNKQYDLAKLKANDMMLAAGIGFNVGNITIGARFNYGMSYIAKNMNYKNWCAQAGVIYNFKLKSPARSGVKKDDVLDL